MKKYKKPLLIVLLILLTPLLVRRNLYKHSAYYAQYTPHKEGIEPVPMMLIDHVRDMHGIYEYSFGGDCFENGRYYRHDYKDAEVVELAQGFADSQGYLYLACNEVFYQFDHDLNIIYALNTNYKRYIPSDEEVAEAKKEMTDAFLPVVKRQWPPLINLQWLFDWVYYDRFN